MITSVIFQLLHRKIENLPKNFTVNVYDKTYVVFNPYPEETKVIHSFLTAFPLVACLISVVIAIVLWKLFVSGLVLSLVALVIGLNLLVVEDASDIYINSKMILKSPQSEIRFGVGDLKGLQILRKALPKITHYYFTLSIVFLILSLVLPFAWNPILLAFTQLLGFIFQISAHTGFMSYQVAAILFALGIMIVHLLVSKVKQKLVGRNQTSHIS
jgi:hypothetical protein